ncbi:hypothetical protein SAMN04487781_4007 [Cellulosimicrobium cellulans]|nr:hypothetical protein SAMN04487781_4007 [Cellulosimicrobium cellulans]
MDIDHTGREWAHWPIVAAPPDEPLEVSFDGGTTWTQMQRVDATTVRVLVAGPAAEDNPDNTAVLALGRNVATVRVAAAPEILVREAGLITAR